VVKFLALEDVVHIHDRAIASAGGGATGLMDIGRVEAAVARMNAGFGSVELYPDVFEKAAALLEALVGNHGFVDGNKRTAMLSATALLELNGWALTYSPDQVVAFAIGVATHEIEFDEIVRWLREHSERDD
jgi:death-on-curing protein